MKVQLGLPGNGNGGYVKLENPSGGADCFPRKYRPWQFKVLLLLALILLISWLCYSGIIDGSRLFPNRQPVSSVAAEQRTGDDPYRYAKSESNFYEHKNSTTVVSSNKMPSTPSDADAVRRKGGKKLIEQCKLPRVDPWDPAIEYYLDPGYYMNWQRDCKRAYPELTRLVNGYVVMHPAAKSNGTVCEFKCLYPHTDFDFVESAWKGISEEPDCDVVETRCRHEKIRNNEFYYNYVHAQIYRRLEWKQERKWSRPEATTTPPSVVDVEKTPDFGPDNGQGKKRRLPDVHVIILDSVSHTQFLRTMPKTVTWLRERMGAISFPHLNKIGLNSRPNGYGIFFGIQSYPVEASPMGEEYKPPRNLDTMGGIYLDHEPFVGFEYRERNYRTMMAEDWGKGVFNWPRNYGFERAPVEHYMRPFQLRTESPYDSDKILTKIVHEKSCKEPHHHVMQYLADFIDVYEEQPKFSISWMSEIAHYSVNGPYRMDAEVYHFLRDYEAKLNNSFLLVMGDHGLRFGGIRWTKQGEIEDNNPALFLALPEHLRYNNRLMDNLRANARELITHFDIHATLVNIARQSADMTVHSPFDQLAPELRGPTPLGQSLLYPFDKSVPRNCGTLRIPFEFCQCQFQTRNVTEAEPKLGLQLAEAMALKMNADVAGKRADDKCAPLAVNPNRPVELIEFEPELGIDLFKVTYETLPGNGRFWGYMKVEERGLPSQNYTAISNRFARLNEYADQSFCTDNYAIAPYCFCKELLKTGTTKTTTTATSTTNLLGLAIV